MKVLLADLFHFFSITLPPPRAISPRMTASKMPPPWLFAGVFVLFQLSVVAGHGVNYLDCDFRSECCWEGDADWKIQEKHSFNINEFRRTFLVGRSKTPPVNNYLIRESTGNVGKYTSCPFCSADGAVLIQFRHWQSPTARLKLCYKISNQTAHKACQMASVSKQSHVTSHLFRVPRAQKIQVFFLSETAEASSSSTVIIDKIKIQYLDCHSPQSVIPPRPRKKTLVASANRTIEEAVSKRNKQLSEAVTKKFLGRSSKKLNIKKVPTGLSKHSTAAIPLPPRAMPQPPGTVTTASSATTTSVPLPAPPPSPQRPPIALPTSSGKDFNPLNDLLGEQLANFLDPNYVTDDKNEPDEGDEDTVDEDLITPASHTATHSAGPSPPPPKAKNPHSPTHLATLAEKKLISGSVVLSGKPVPINRPGLLSELHRPIPLGVPSTCETPGGCLFEKGFCSWKAPDDIPASAQFRMSKVGPSTFIQAKVPTAEVSIIQVDTKMNENHTIIFDALEWQNGSRLIGCCFVNTNLHCPFATPTEQGAILWQISKFECPTGTDKLLFICENYGLEDAVCGIDNVRLHRSTDIFFLEPCQKQLLSTL